MDQWTQGGLQMIQTHVLAKLLLPALQHFFILRLQTLQRHLTALRQHNPRARAKHNLHPTSSLVVLNQIVSF